MKRHRLFAFAAIVLLSVVSCSKSNNPEAPDPDPFEKEGLTSYFDKSLFPGKVAILGVVDDIGMSWLKARAGGSFTSPQDADIIVAGNAALANVEATRVVVKAAYDSGKFIVVTHANIENIKKFRDENGWKFTLPAKQPESECMIGFAPHYCCLLEPPSFKNNSGVPHVAHLTCYEFMRPLNNFIDRWMKEKKTATKSSIKAPGLNVDDDYFSSSFQFISDEHIRIADHYSYYRAYSYVTIQYMVMPCYLPEADPDKHGDYYVVKVAAAHDAPLAHTTDGKDFNVSTSGDAKYFIGDVEPNTDDNWRLKGPYKKDLKIKFTAGPDEAYVFAKGFPLPATTIGSTQYYNEESFTVDGGISGGYSSAEGGWSVNAELGFTADKKSSVSATVQDLSTTNNSSSADGKVAYDFKYENLPTEFQDPPECAKSLSSFEMSWIWKTVNSKKDYDTGTFPLLTEVHEEIQMSAQEYYRWENEWTQVVSSHDTSQLRTFPDPKRVPVGCIQINNKCTASSSRNNLILFNIEIHDASTGDVVYSTESSVGKDETFEVLLPQKNRTYYVTLTMGTSQQTADEYISTDQQINLKLLTKDENSRRILTINENGGDFRKKIR